MTRDYGADIRDFLDFLDERQPAHFVTAALSSILRTDPPVAFTPSEVADIVSEWALDRVARTGERASDLYLHATRSIVDAYNVNAVSGFRPRDFYRAYRGRLVEQCPPDERGVLEAALDALQGGGPHRFQRLSASELARVAGSDPRRSASVAAERDFDAAIDRLRERPHLPEDEFAEALAVAERFLHDADLVPTQPALLRAVDAATAAFNGGAVVRAGRLLALVSDALEHPAVAEVRKRDARGGARLRGLDDEILAQWVNDVRRRADAAAVVKFFDDLAPDFLVGALVSETAPTRVQLLLNMLDAHGPGAVPSILDFVAAAVPTQHLGGLIAVVGRHGTASDALRRRGVELLGPLLTSPDPAVREASAAALGRLGGREVVPHALRALEADAYKIEPQGPDATRHLGRVMSMLVVSGLDSAVAVVADTATGVRDGGFGRFGKALRDAALSALEGRNGPLPRRAALAIGEALRGMTRKRLGLFGGLAIGADAETCARLLGLVEDATDSEVRSIAETPALRKLAERRSS